MLFEESLAERVGGGVTVWTGAPVAPPIDSNAVAVGTGVAVGATVGEAVAPCKDSAITV